MQKTNIQWCDSTINPVAGCQGCELWPSGGQVMAAMTDEIIRLTGMPKAIAQREVARFAEKNESLPKKDLIAKGMTQVLANIGCKMSKSKLHSVIKKLKGKLLKCYAGNLGENRGGKIKGYPARFEDPEMFPGRTTMPPNGMISGKPRARKSPG